MIKFSCPGSRMRPIYTSESVSPLHVVKTGEEDQFKLIQASKESVLLENLIQRALDGDVDALDQAHGMYGDFSEVPTNLAEVIEAYNRGLAAFERLPADVRETYGTIEELLKDFDSGDLARKFTPRGQNPTEKENVYSESGDVNE